MVIVVNLVSPEMWTPNADRQTDRQTHTHTHTRRIDMLCIRDEQRMYLCALPIDSLTFNRALARRNIKESAVMRVG